MRGVSHELALSHPRACEKSYVKNLAGYTDNCGSQVRSGRRQKSIPSKSIDSCARVRQTVPFAACGHTKRPGSSRFANKHNPSPSDHSTLIRSPRRPRNTNTCPTAITIEEIRRWFDAQKWRNGTSNRYRSTLSLIYRLGIENAKVRSNPAKLLRHKREDNERNRFLHQFSPATTELDYLKVCGDEESRLRAVLASKYAAHVPEFEIALNTGMRPSEQYRLTWR